METGYLNRGVGCLLGLAVGDALGTTLEFSKRDSSPHHTEMLGRGPFGLKPGQWTDDTSMALALADSLIEQNGLNPADLMNRFVAWRDEGRYSCTGRCFDIGTTTNAALTRFLQTGDPMAGSDDPQQAGNGSLMRLAPVALYALHDADLARRLAQEQSRTTHAAPEAIAACELLVTLLSEAVQGAGMDVLRPRRLDPASPVLMLAAGGWKNKTRDRIRSSGYVMHTLEAAMWSVGTTTSFEEAVIRAVNLGEDADTVGAVTGQLAGAIYGLQTIPGRWLGPLAWRAKIEEMAANLLEVPSTAV